jgi:hypothetical protein
MRSAPVWALLIVLLSLNHVAAQEPEAPPVFLEAAGFVGFERMPNVRFGTRIINDRDVSGTVWGGGVAVGTFLAPRVSLRLDAAFPGRVESSYSEQTGFAFFGSGLTQLLSNRVEETRRERSAAVLLGYHTGRRYGVRLGFLAGVAFIWQEATVVQRTFPSIVPLVPLPPSGSFQVFPSPIDLLPSRLERSETTSTSYRTAPAVGLDADIALGSRFALVPRIRVQAGGGLLSLRPGIALRWIP